jgi:antitoxin MazE
MRAKVQEWGKQFGDSIAKPDAQGIGLRAEADIELSVQQESFILAPNRREYSLKELVRGITPKNRHEETDFGPPVGREIL